MGKGGGFEREMCKLFSFWWTGEKRDDVYWRSSQSGGRATVRQRKGRGTAGSFGDMAAIDPVGAPLLDLFTIELKRGYSKFSFCDVIDRPNGTRGTGQQTWDVWHQQATTAARCGGSYSWLIVHRRDGRIPILFYPYHVHRSMVEHGCFPDKLNTFVRFRTKLRHRFEDEHKRIRYQQVKETVVVMTLTEFFKGVRPQQIKELVKWL